MQKSYNTLLTLPIELLLIIFSRLDNNDKLNLLETNKILYDRLQKYYNYEYILNYFDILPKSYFDKINNIYFNLRDIKKYDKRVILPKNWKNIFINEYSSNLTNKNNEYFNNYLHKYMCENKMIKYNNNIIFITYTYKHLQTFELSPSQLNNMFHILQKMPIKKNINILILANHGIEHILKPLYFGHYNKIITIYHISNNTIHYYNYKYIPWICKIVKNKYTFEFDIFNITIKLIFISSILIIIIYSICMDMYNKYILFKLSRKY